MLLNIALDLEELNYTDKKYYYFSDANHDLRGAFNKALHRLCAKDGTNYDLVEIIKNKDISDEKAELKQKLAVNIVKLDLQQMNNKIMNGCWDEESEEHEIFRNYNKTSKELKELVKTYYSGHDKSQAEISKNALGSDLFTVILTGNFSLALEEMGFPELSSKIRENQFFPLEKGSQELSSKVKENKFFFEGKFKSQVEYKRVNDGGNTDKKIHNNCKYLLKFEIIKKLEKMETREKGVDFYSQKYNECIDIVDKVEAVIGVDFVNKHFAENYS